MVFTGHARFVMFYGSYTFHFVFQRIATPSGLTSIPAGLETPEMIELRCNLNLIVLMSFFALGKKK